jgi:hypothetical protein
MTRRVNGVKGESDRATDLDSISMFFSEITGVPNADEVAAYLEAKDAVRRGEVTIMTFSR